MNRALVLGIRPECFHLCPVEGNGLTMEIEVTINHVELFGSHVHVHADTDLGNRIVARAQADFGRNDVASRLKLYAHPRHVHLFEPGETGMNLCLNQLPNHAIA
jgi:ABC-type sugar transport system ATPase subunit